MPLIAFDEFLGSEGLAFGQPQPLLATLRERTEAGVGVGDLLDSTSGLSPEHLLPIRQAVMRYAALKSEAEHLERQTAFRSRLDLQAWRFATRLSPDDEGRRVALAGAFSALVAQALKQARLRMRLIRPGDPRAAPFADLQDHTDGCADIPPHRWFKLSRALADGLMEVELILPEGEAERALGPLASRALAEELARSAKRPVLQALADRSEREAIATATGALRGLLRRPPIDGPVGGLAIDDERLFAAVEPAGRTRVHRSTEIEPICAFFAAESASHVGLVRLRALSTADLTRRLTERGFAVELVREAGLMKQARSQGGPIYETAARVAARRLQDPIESTAGLQADELGLGEYLEQVDPGRLRAALEDEREAARWLRAHGLLDRAAAHRGLSLNPLVRTLQDLRPGMELEGVVHNLTHFGAFVELGLEVQGLVHLSELADRRVEHPAEVVQVGQRVRARIVELDLARGRIGLSLRERQKPARASKRSAALGALDALFKK